MSNLIEQLNWRYATKRMTGEKIPAEKLQTILEAIRLTASNAGLQPYTIFVISNEELKKEIHQKACPQPQVLESSHLLVFTNKTNISSEYIDEMMQLVSTTRNAPLESLSGFSSSLKNYFGGKTEEEKANLASRDAHIALGTALIAAASELIDAAPMGGFNPTALDEVLNLKEKGLQSTVLLALGYRNQELDLLSKAKKARKPFNELFIKI
ncbi:NAD(P)H-dependent oxidoreductase [Sphingobacterium sp. 18053]|uniref:NAD(P)H-dependent oxidoreductase n=1 Tax=Sphingobacterium sp. 18053 TaxID=2681401 RepID=UPI00135A3D2A|nr:NAD(P)H-dependent oxidoreductase [Sphingobacterium sp. 18053]